MKFIGRLQELKLMEQHYATGHSVLLPIYGRRRVGKSRMIEEFIAGKPNINFLGKRTTAEMQLKDFREAALKLLNNAALEHAQFTSWQAALHTITRLWTRPEKLVLIMDELQWTAEASPELPSILQGLWDKEWKKASNIMIILCGSHVGFMEREILGQKSPLFGRRSDQIKLGPLGAWSLPNRILLAPLTRARAGAERIPNQLMAEYYAQRASAGLIISEATSVTPMGVGYADTPGIWSHAQVAGWKLVTESVHKAGGRILLQLWHVGRISDPMFLNGALPVAPSAIAAAGHVSLVRPLKAFVTPRALELKEIPGIIEAYRQGAENAKLAGFDGVEIHGANGYLLDQFLQDKTNHRTDAYGGPIENRARLMLEVTDAVISVWGADRVGMHLAPRGDHQDMGDSNPLATFGFVAVELGRRGLAFICARESLGENRLGPQLKKIFGGSYIANEKFTQATANQVLAAGEADAVAFGVPFLANPDLPKRFQQNAALNAPDQSTFYAPGEKGYTDYPFLPLAA